MKEVLSVRGSGGLVVIIFPCFEIISNVGYESML